MRITFDTGIPGMTPAYAVFNSSGTVFQARTGVGVTDLGGGTYSVEVADATLAGRTVLWDTGDADPDYASESFPATLEYAAPDNAGIAAIQLKTDTIGALAVTVRSPVASSGTITLYAGDDYDATHGRSVDFSVAVADVPDLAGATVNLKAKQATWTATACTSDGTDWTIVVEPDAAGTAALTWTQQSYELEATLADGDVVTLATGMLIVVKDIPAV